MRAAVLLIVAAASFPAQSQVFKCDVGGKTVYQQVPCIGESKSINLSNAAKPSASDVAAARARAESDRRKLAIKGSAPPKNRDEACIQATNKAKTSLEMKKARALCGVPEPAPQQSPRHNFSEVGPDGYVYHY